MIRKSIAGLVGVVLIVSLSGCYSAPVMPPMGSVYANIKAPIDTDADGLDRGTRTGTSSACSILGLVAWGDASVDAAAEEGGLSNVNHVDYEFYHVLGIYQKFTTVAHGD